MSGNLLQIIAVVLSVLAAGASIISLLYSRKTSSIRSLFSEEDEPENLQDIIGVVAKKIKRLETGHQEHDNELGKLSTKLDTAIRFVGIVRFDSASSDGGNLSFSVAMLDTSQSGIVFTSLHGREHNRVYIKDIKNGASESVLSDEEKEAIIKAVASRSESGSTKSTKRTSKQIK